MYTDEDLNLAVEKKIFSNSSATEFRQLISTLRDSPAVDEENFRLIGGFNDIFIVIASLLLLFSSSWVLNSFHESLGYLVFTVLSWGLAEFFVLKRKMALPAIILLLAFIGGVFIFTASLFSEPSETSIILTTVVSTAAAYAHWKRFNVPITMAVGTAAAIGAFISVLLAVFPSVKDWFLTIIFISGLIAFSFAMYWDASDTNRTTRRADVAFWLHLLSAPLIIHPVFSRLGILNGDESLSSMAIVILLYLLMTTISIAVDRRAFMVSSLIYVLYALSSLIKTYGGVGYSFALTGVIMGAALLLLSAYWHRVRIMLIAQLPESVTQRLPRIKTV
ncbi:MAG: hypothetical protein ACJAYG_000540 [Oceanicoccus sp.]|jgi:hypothetical protein